MDFDWKIRSGHKQETREGYNLLDFNVTQNSKVTVNEDGTLTINGAGGFSLNIDKLQLKAGITYYQKVELISGSISGSNINNTFLSFAGTGKWISSEIFTESSFNEDTEKTVIWINASATFDNAVIKIWANTNKSDFEQYGASPSPDYPSEIKTVGSNVNLINKENVTKIYFNQNQINIGSTSKTIVEKCSPKTTYTISKMKSTKLRVCTTNVFPAANVTISDYVQNDTGDKITIKTSDNANYICIYFYDSNSDKLTEQEILNTLKLEKGSVATPYSPYGMGSVEIDVVNKNFINKNKISKGLMITATGEVTNSKYFSTDYIKVSKNETYYANEYVPVVAAYDKDKKSIGYIRNTLTGGSFNTGNAVYIRARNNVQLSTEEEIQNAIDKAMIIKGSTSSDYIEHQSQTAIMPVQQEMLTGDYVADVEHHEWGKLVLTGKENWNMLYGAGMFHVTNLVRVKDINSRTSISNYFKYNNANNGIYTNLEDGELAVQYYEGNTTLYIKYLNISTVEDFKTWLKTKHNEGNSVIIYYKQATPVDLELTEEQKAIREQKLYTYKNITNIAVSDELASIDVEYKKDQDTINKNYENRLAALETASTSEEV